jgi:single-stranded DNA-specific DHH superfamily exonuclease
VRPPQSITKTLTGLIANQLIAKYQRPVLILNKTVYKNEETNESYEMWEGSGRGWGIDSLQSFLSDSGFVRYAEGHDNALGVGIADADFDEFIKYANETLKDFDFTPKYMVDFIYNSNNINGMDILEVASMKQLWGQGVTSSLVAVENIPITKDNIQLMKGTTLKITLPGESKVSLIKFRSSNEEYESLYSELGCVTINIVEECQINDFGGVETPQIEIKDYEIVGRAAYYF